MQKNKEENYLIFTDLDGTLLDHQTYSFNEANEMIEYLKSNNIPLIIVTSKTKEEILILRKKLNIDFPFIVENGAGIFIPNKNSTIKQISMGKTYTESLTFLEKYKSQFTIKGFNDLNSDVVSALTGLDKESAQKAKNRDFSEPFIIEDEDRINEFKKICLENGFDVVKGGRFFHLITKGQDKANALLELKSIYEKQDKCTYKTISLGDGENDKTMLASTDYSVLIKKYDGTFIDFEKKDLIKTTAIGPKGWNEALKEILCK
jgi:mannosyl-3-phosphoglycerate phosphatase